MRRLPACGRFPPNNRPQLPMVPPTALRGESDTPVWDAEHRELRVREQVVKRYKVPCPGQESILAAFQEEGWPPAIDDPLPPHPEQDQRRRLRNTIQNLNANQRITLIRFGGDGSGERVLWELVNRVRPGPPAAGPGGRLTRIICGGGLLAQSAEHWPEAQAKSKPSPGSISACRRFTVYQKGPSSETSQRRHWQRQWPASSAPTGRDYYLAGGCQL